MSWSVIVVAKGMWDVTQKFLDTLLETTNPGQISEILYFDNATPSSENSWGRSLDWKEKNQTPTLKVTRLSAGYPSMSLSEAWNASISLASSDKILVCNNDIVFGGPGWLDEFENGLGTEGIGIVGLIGMSWKNTPFIQGSIMGFKRTTYDAAGKFDTRYEFTCEDVAFAKEVGRLGLGIKSYEKFRDDGTIQHLEGATRNYYKDDTKHYQYLAHLSRLRFCYQYTYPDINIHD